MTDPRFPVAQAALVASLGDDHIALPCAVLERAIQRILTRIDAIEYDRIKELPVTTYPIEHLDHDNDNGTMPENVTKLSESVVGHRITNVEKDINVTGSYGQTEKATLNTDQSICGDTQCKDMPIGALGTVTNVFTSGGYGVLFDQDTHGLSCYMHSDDIEAQQ